MDEMKPIIEVIMGQIRSQYEDGIYNAVQNYGISVDKERLIQALKDAKEFWHEGYKDGYRAAVWEQPRWISVEERLPDSGVHVLLTCEMHRYGGGLAGKYVCDGFYVGRFKEVAGGFPDECACEYSEEDDEYYLCEGWYEVIKNWDDYNSVAIGDFVTHWMPLPEPPEVEG